MRSIEGTYESAPACCGARQARLRQDAGVGTLMLLDAASLYFRAFYGVPETMTAPDGTPVNAVRGLLDMISRLLRARHPARLIACMDADWRPAFRVAALPVLQGAPGQPGRLRAGARPR